MRVWSLGESGDLPALKLGGRGSWRIERSMLEEYIARAYEETHRELANRRSDGRDPEEVLDSSAYLSDDDYRQEEGGEA